jgi:hypothetical protein
MDASTAFADGLRTLWTPGINQVETPIWQSVDAWLCKGAYIWQSAGAGCAELNVIGTDRSYADALASEISRFSCAAYESLLDASPPEHATKSLGWSLVRHYYAAFYCAHAIFRIAGSSITYLQPSTVATLNKVGGQSLGISPQLPSGLYLIETDSTNPKTVRLKNISAGSGGSHEDMWKLFLLLLTNLENTILRYSGQLQLSIDAVAISKELRRHLCYQGKGNGAWASKIRNSINYQHGHGVWFPYQLPQKECTDLNARLVKWRPHVAGGLDIGKSTSDLRRFADVCNVVTRLMTAALTDISRRSPKAGKNFVDKGPFKLLRQRKIIL